MSITNMDKSHTIVVNVDLIAEEFNNYIIKKEKIVIGINVAQFHKLISTIGSNESLSLYIDNLDYCDGVVSYLTMQFINDETKQSKTYKLRLIEPDMEEIDYPDVHYSTILNLPSVDFQKIIRDMSNISEKMEMRLVGNELMFRCVGQFASCEILRVESDNSSNTENPSLHFVEKQDASKVIQGEFSLKNLSYFTKCTPLCQQIEIYFENDMPLIIKYKVASLGKFELGLSSLPC